MRLLWHWQERVGGVNTPFATIIPLPGEFAKHDIILKERGEFNNA